MRTKLKNDTPVQHKYNTITKQLYSEMKQYQDDLLNKQWIIHSYSEYECRCCSRCCNRCSVVDAVKNYGTAHLCGLSQDYQKLNGKIIPHRLLLSRIQNVIYSLGGRNSLHCWIKVNHTISYTYILISKDIMRLEHFGDFVSRCVCTLGWWRCMLVFNALWSIALVVTVTSFLYHTSMVCQYSQHLSMTR